ncbi:MAG: hypothetical protein CL677_07920 [Bdellovibrionaceae bacterium]|nr:hypothetical protein [Pseudobdellovibrionaceae bacterium]|tara:strand:+ start:65906 stop:66859 length:954 start_codon:yes stop_codon:yes gene_type:complete
MALKLKIPSPSKDIGSIAQKLEPFHVPLLVFLLAYTTADLAMLSLRTDMLPKQSPPTKSSSSRKTNQKFARDYFVVEDRNIFNADGKIPPALSEGEGQSDEDGPAVPSNLPLKLLGTIVHVNTDRSVASVESRRSNKAAAYSKGDDIEGLAEVVRVERRKLVFRNLSNRRLEYIEIPKDFKINLGISTAGNSGNTGFQENDLVKELGQNRFEVRRDDVNRLTKDISGLLREARMTQNIVPNSGGRIEGFRFTWIKPNSVFEKLGMKVGDVIKGVEGEPINDPRKAMEAYNALRSADNIRLTVIRNGREEELNYSISE